MLNEAKSDTAMCASGYRLDAVIVEPRVDKPRLRRCGRANSADQLIRAQQD